MEKSRGFGNKLVKAEQALGFSGWSHELYAKSIP